MIFASDFNVLDYISYDVLRDVKSPRLARIRNASDLICKSCPELPLVAPIAHMSRTIVVTAIISSASQNARTAKRETSYANEATRTSLIERRYRVVITMSIVPRFAGRAKFSAAVTVTTVVTR